MSKFVNTYIVALTLGEHHDESITDSAELAARLDSSSSLGKQLIELIDYLEIQHLNARAENFGIDFLSY